MKYILVIFIVIAFSAFDPANLKPFAPFGIATVSRQVEPQLPEFLYALSRAQGAEADYGPLFKGASQSPSGIFYCA